MEALLHVTHRFPSAPDREWHELHHLESAFATPANAGADGQSQYRLLGELAEYVRALASERPLVMVLDEMQWADGTTWDALEHLRRAARHGSDHDLPRRSARIRVTETLAAPADAQRHEIVRELTISRLTRDEVKQWLEAAFHRQQVGREFLAFLYRHTEGNPLFIAQLLRALVEDGAIWYNGTRWEWTPGLGAAACRRDARALIAQRLSRFSSSTQAVLATAAIIGREFDVGLLVGAGAGSEPAVRLAMSEAAPRDCCGRRFERRAGGFAFAHDEIAEVLVESIPRDRAAQLHQRVAQALERRRPERARRDRAALRRRAASQRDAYRVGADRREGRGARVRARRGRRVSADRRAQRDDAGGARRGSRALAHVAETGGRYDEVEELCDLAIEWFEGRATSVAR